MVDGVDTSNTDQCLRAFARVRLEPDAELEPTYEVCAVMSAPWHARIATSLGDVNRAYDASAG